MEPSDEQELAARLEAARLKQHGAGGVAGRRKREAANNSAWGLGGRVGVELVSALIAGIGLGWMLDRWCHSRPLFLILGVIFGGASGVWNVWRLIR